MTMKKALLIPIVIYLLTACAGGGDSSSSTSNATSQQDLPSIDQYDPNRGVGKFTEVEIPEAIDPELALAGEAVFKMKCASCHRLTDERLVGPGFKGVTKKHDAVWIMNFLTNTEEMIDLDPELQAQLEICLVRMPNQNLTDDDTRAIYEFMRQNDE